MIDSLCHYNSLGIICGFLLFILGRWDLFLSLLSFLNYNLQSQKRTHSNFNVYEFLLIRYSIRMNLLYTRKTHIGE